MYNLIFPMTIGTLYYTFIGELHSLLKWLAVHAYIFITLISQIPSPQQEQLTEPSGEAPMKE